MDTDVYQGIANAVEVACGRARVDMRERVAESATIGPYDDAGVAEPGKEKGPGFAIFIGEFRCGWFKTRDEACECWEMISLALRKGRWAR